MEDKDRFVDELLDSALAQQRRAEPRAGFEGRILERVRATAGKEISGGNTWKLWAAAAATAVVVVTFVAIRVANRSQSPAVQTSQASKATPALSPREILTANSGTTPRAGTATTVVEPKRVERRIRRSSRRIETPRWPAQFPTPAPLTEEQKALVQYVRETPPEVLAASLFERLPESQPAEIKPVEITPVEIRPLSVRKPEEELQ